MTLGTNKTQELRRKAAKLNEQFAGLNARQILSRVINGGVAGRAAVLSSFGAEAAVLLKLVAEKNPATPVVFLDTRKHFPETLAYVENLTDALGLTTLVRARPSYGQLAVSDPDGNRHATAPDRCCYARKTLPMISTLRNFDCVLTGRKRHQTDDRAQMDVVEVQESWLSINPLADWSLDEVRAYAREMALPAHPLVSQGFQSIGCQPCTQPSEDYRAGRWAGSDKTECGIHITKDGKVRRIGANTNG